MPRKNRNKSKSPTRTSVRIKQKAKEKQEKQRQQDLITARNAKSNKKPAKKKPNASATKNKRNLH